MLIALCVKQNMTVNDECNFVSTNIVHVMKQYVPLRVTTSKHNPTGVRKGWKKLYKRKKQLYIVK